MIYILNILKFVAGHGAVVRRWALDWTWIGLDPDYAEFCWI